MSWEEDDVTLLPDLTVYEEDPDLWSGLYDAEGEPIVYEDERIPLGFEIPEGDE